MIRLGRAMRARLPLVRQPLLVVLGRHDSVIHPDSGDIIVNGAESVMAEMHWMEDSSHVVILDDELDAIARLTLAFMERALAM